MDVHGDAKTRNGSIRMAPASTVDGNVSTRNGSADLDSAHIARNLRGWAGDLSLRNASRVDGNVIIKIRENSGGSGWFSRWRSQYTEAGDINILEGSEVGGDVIVSLPIDYDEKMPVIRIDASSRVHGNVKVDERLELHIEGQVGGQIERISH